MTIGRPRTASDEQVVAAAVRVISRVGPTGLTLAEVGREIGLSPAAVMQRFGSKRGLLLALMRHSTLTAAQRFRGTDPVAGGDPMHALVEGMAERTEGLTPEALSNHLAFLQMDLVDPEFRQLAAEHARAVRHGIQGCLDAAVEAGMLPDQDTASLARSVQVTYNGALVSWALEPEGALGDWVRREIQVVLAAGHTRVRVNGN